MKQYKFVLKPRSFFSTIFASDTIFGTVCWYVRYLAGEDALVSMLRDFESDPPFLISSLIPRGFLPRPLLPFSLKEKSEDIDKSKKLKKIKWIPIELFSTYQNNYNSDKIAEKEDLFRKEEEIAAKLQAVEVTRNSISRETGTVIEGILFSDTYLCARDIEFNIYITEYSDKYSSIFHRAFALACELGLGREASIGKGRFEIKQEELNEIEKKIFAAKGSHFVSLSLCAGKNLEPLSYATFTRYGKLGGEFSQKGIDGTLLYNKKPIVFYKEGSTFRANNRVNGALLKNVHVDSRIVQYAYAYPLYFNPEISDAQ
ncbi:MAG: type III-A CRISPR-associated RAMP protein Csm4 [Spirochaetes bacterium]|nr:type III-A CRISPR-associated RAMP protein Csm4 [Spirochaetota bacterium]